MTDWQLVSDETPKEQDVLLWLAADAGMDAPIGALVGRYIKTDIFEGWVEKSATGNMNTGLRQDLVTHWKEIGDGP